MSSLSTSIAARRKLKRRSRDQRCQLCKVRRHPLQPLAVLDEYDSSAPRVASNRVRLEFAELRSI